MPLNRPRKGAERGAGPDECSSAPRRPAAERRGVSQARRPFRLEEAYHFSDAAHQGQLRKSGEPYISHPVAVAEILSQWQLDAQTLVAALLHDVVEDTEVSTDDISRRFGKPVADLVDGVSKLDRIEFQSQQDAQAENFRKMLLAMARDVRVMLIKLADRLHNMRTLDAVAPAKRRRVACETLEIYAPIANRLGLDGLYRELQELGFQHIHPMRYRGARQGGEGGARQPPRGCGQDPRGDQAAARRRAARSVGHRPGEAYLLDLQEDDREEALLHRGARHLRLPRRRARIGVPACYVALGALHSRSTSRCPASSRTTSPSRS